MKLSSFKKDAVAIISIAAAVISSFFLPVHNYFRAVDVKVIVMLFLIMACVSGLKKINLFGAVADSIALRVKSTKLLQAALILLAYFVAMIFTNDVALITLVPFTILLLTITAQEGRVIFVVVMQTVAANLGSMLTPIGNPQNLFLYSYYGFDPKGFFAVTIPAAGLSLIMIMIACLFGRDSKIQVTVQQKEQITDMKGLAIYLVLFGISVAAVFSLISYVAAAAIVTASIVLYDKRVLQGVDYGLLATFVFFFIFSDNMSSIGAVRSFFQDIMQGRELMVSALLSQFISNVPAAVLLSSVCKDGTALVLGTNLGGLGTPVASLASLISFKLYCGYKNAKPRRYLSLFCAVNFTMLLLLLLVFH